MNKEACAEMRVCEAVLRKYKKPVGGGSNEQTAHWGMSKNKQNGYGQTMWNDGHMEKQKQAVAGMLLN